jgi:hypothetical protein
MNEKAYTVQITADLFHARKRINGVDAVQVIATPQSNLDTLFCGAFSRKSQKEKV